MLKKYDPNTNTRCMSKVNTTVVTAIEPKIVSSLLSDSTSGVNDQIQSKTEGNDKSVIDAFMKDSGISIVEKNTPETSSIMYLVNAIADSLPLAEEFLHELRKANCSQSGHFNYFLIKQIHDKEKCEAVIKLANTMKNCGVFSELQICPNKNLSGTISTASRVRNFISGTWLEFYSQQKALNIVKEFAESKGLSYEIYCNLKVMSNAGTKHEIDLMFSVGDVVFGAEMKSGLNFCDFDKYRLMAEWMHLIPDRFLLLNSALVDDNAAECVSYFYRYYICSVDTYEKTIITMLNKAFEG